MEDPAWIRTHLKSVVWWQPGWTGRDQEVRSFHGVGEY